MQAPLTPADEPLRQAELNDLCVLNTPPEERYDRYTRLARELLQVEIALVSLIDGDRQWFKSRQGLDASETPRSISFCGHAILSEDALVVEDALLDPRFADNPLVLGELSIRFYAGMPLHGPTGQRVGTLCVIDSQSRKLAEREARSLRDLAQCIEQEFKLREVHDVQERFAAIIKSSDDAVVTLDLEGKITSWNPSAERVFGYSHQEAVGQSALMLVPPGLADATQRMHTRVAQGEHIQRFETQRVGRNSQQIHVSTSLSHAASGNSRAIHPRRMRPPTA